MPYQIYIGKLVLVVLICFASSIHAAEIRVAVAANFLATLKTLAPLYEQQTGDRLIVSGASSGKLFAQVINGAPYDVFLSADGGYPEQLIQHDKALASSRFVYATGVLVLWSRINQPLDKNSFIAEGINHIAIANPATSPYGAAARQTLIKLGLLDKVKHKLVQGESIGQTFLFVASGNAQLGFVALSQVVNPANPYNQTNYWRVPADYHSPLAQEAVLLQHGKDNVAAKRFLEYLKSDAARNVMAQYGYL